MTITLYDGTTALRQLELPDNHYLVMKLLESQVVNKVLLTNREVEILHHLADGKRSKEIGVALKISEYTVGTHIRNIFHKLNVRNRAEAVAKTGIAGYAKSTN